MSVKWRVLDSETKSFSLLDPRATALIGPAGGGIPLDYSPTGLDRAAGNEIVYACLELRANTLLDPLLVVERARGDDYERDEDHPLRQLLAWPNPEMDEAEFWRAAQQSVDISDRFYSEIVRSAAGVPVELWPLDPLKVVEKYRRAGDGTLELDHYEWRDGRATKRIEPEAMLARRIWSVGTPRSRLAAALGSADADAALTEYSRAYFAGGGVPSGVLKIHNRSLQEGESDRLRSQWVARYGRGAPGGPAVLDQNADYQKVGDGMKDADGGAVADRVESRICMAFGVPPLIVYAHVGLLRATYSNLKEAWAGYWDATASPLLRLWRGWATRAMLPLFEPQEDVRAGRVRLDWDLSKVAAMQDDVDALHARARDGLAAGLLLPDEAREIIGLGPMPAAAAPQEDAPKGGAQVAEKRETKAQIVARGILEATTEREVLAVLASQYRDAAKRAGEMVG